MAEPTKRTGGCHCGKVRYEVTVALPLDSVIECNCSMCSKKAALMTFVAADDFRLLSGEDELGDYQFNRRHIHHHFCRTCGIHAFAAGVGRDGKPMRMVNVRCLEDTDLSPLKVVPYDGKSH